MTRSIFIVIMLICAPSLPWADETGPPSRQMPRPESAPASVPDVQRDTQTPHEGDKVQPTDEKEKQRALEAFLKKKGFINVTAGTMLCSDPHLSRGYVVAGKRRKDLLQPVDVYEIVEHVAKPMKNGLLVYLTKPEKEQGGIDMVYEDADHGMVVYRVFECKLKLQKSAAKPKKKT